MRALATFAIVLCTSGHLAPPATWAEEAPTIGTRVRVTYDAGGRSTRLEGRFAVSSIDSLVISRSGSELLPVSWTSVRGLERFDGRRGHASTGAMVGFFVGAGAGALAAATFKRESQFFAPSEGVAIGLGILVATTGTGLGALIGALVRTDRWRDVPLPMDRPSSQP